MSFFNLSNLFNEGGALSGYTAAPAPAPVAAPAPAYSAPAPAPAAPSSMSEFNKLFPNFDLSQGFNTGYMNQFSAPGGGYGGDSGQYYDNGYQIKGTDGNMWTISPDFAGRGGYTLTSSDPLDNHNRYQLGFDASGKMTSNQNWKDKSWMDDNAGIIAVLGAAAGGQMAFGGGFGGATGGVGGAAEAASGTGAVTSPVYGGTAIGTPLTGASPGVIGAGGAAAAGGVGAAGAGGAAGGAGGLASSIGTKVATSGLGSIISNAIGGGSTGGAGGTGGGLGSSLGGLVTGGLDYYNQNRAADQMLDYMKQQQAKIDSIYSPEGPLAKTMYAQMSAQDAAAGRNSQYGTRTTDFLGKFGGDYAKATAGLAQGLAGNYANAFNQQASAGTGLATAAGKAIGGGLGSAIGNAVTQNMSSYVSPATTAAGSMMGSGNGDLWSQGWGQALNGVNNGGLGDYIYG